MIKLFDTKEECCGCTACISICPIHAITTQTDEEGFLYPKIDYSLCLECGLCKKVCAFQNGYNTSSSLGQPDVFALKHKSNDVRMNSTSGGAFTAISDYVLLKNGVIYGAAYDEALRVTHQRAETAVGRNRFRGSKYVQSDLNQVFSQIGKDIKNDRTVLFTGTTCQVAGLNSYLAQSKINIDKLVTIDIICHGVPSPRVFSDFIAYCEHKNKSKITQYYFRSKVNGWGHTEEAVYENGKHDYNSLLSQTHKELFYSDLCLRPACHKCKYTNFDRPSDFTIADYWGIENCLPEFKDTLGVSAIILNTRKGKDIFSYLKGSTESVLSNIYDCAVKQRNLHTPTPMNIKRNEFWSDYLVHDFDYIIRKYTGYGLKKELKGASKRILSKVGLLKFAIKVLKR